MEIHAFESQGSEMTSSLLQFGESKAHWDTYYFGNFRALYLIFYISLNHDLITIMPEICNIIMNFCHNVTVYRVQLDTPGVLSDTHRESGKKNLKL